MLEKVEDLVPNNSFTSSFFQVHFISKNILAKEVSIKKSSLQLKEKLVNFCIAGHGFFLPMALAYLASYHI